MRKLIWIATVLVLFLAALLYVYIAQEEQRRNAQIYHEHSETPPAWQ